MDVPISSRQRQKMNGQRFSRRPGRMPVFMALVCGALAIAAGRAASGAVLPRGVRAVWDVSKAYRESTQTRERVCINGLWRWQPAQATAERPPTGNWGYFKVPGPWPGITSYIQKDCQTLYAHPSWQDVRLSEVKAAWYQREITIPRDWTGRRIALYAEYVNSFAAVYIDGRQAGDIRFPAGELDLTAVCRPGGKYTLSMLVVAMPLKGVMLSYNDTNAARKVAGSVSRRGLCGDVYLISTPRGARITGIRVDTSVRNWEITCNAWLADLAPGASYVLRATVMDGERAVKEFRSEAFTADDLKDGCYAFSAAWHPSRLWDIHTPQNMYRLDLSLEDAAGKVLDEALPVRFGFREFWIEGRDFYLNGTRIFLSSVPLDNAQIGAAWANYEAVCESLRRLKGFGINYVYTHNYGCQPGSHLSFTEELRAADDVGMLIGLSMPHFGHYDWSAPDADKTNGYARHAAFYARVAANHPSVVFYPMSHNATGYTEDMNPDLIDGIHAPRDSWSMRNVQRALHAEAIVKRLDPTRIVYHHSSGSLSSMHTMNFYANFAPSQELCDWFKHWATVGVKPVFTCEYTVPMSWDWTMYRGWYQGHRAFGSAVVPWEFCLAEWNSQFYGARAFKISEMEKENLRWEAAQFRAGQRWHRWDYPHEVGSSDFPERDDIFAEYFKDVWPAYRTYGMSANSPWAHGQYWRLRPGITETRVELPVDWDNLQRPGFSPDYVEDRYERMDLAYRLSDWIATSAAKALYRYNAPLLAYIAGKPGDFTEKGHNFYPGETVEKQLIVINNSRVTVTCDCEWTFGLPRPVSGSKTVSLPTGEQVRIPLRFELPATVAAGRYEIRATVRFSSGQTQTDTFAVHVMPRPEPVKAAVKVALFDPKGETAKLLEALGLDHNTVDANADLSGYDVLVIGKGALTVQGPAPDITAVRDGLKVVVFEQTAEALEKRLGFRVVEYGLRWVFERVPDHPLVAGLSEQNLRYWRGSATLTPPRLKYELSRKFNFAPTVRWCGIPVTRVWRCGNSGNVASVLIEKPACGDFLPVLDGGYSLQYSPLMEYREGKGMVLFCQMDVTGRTEQEPAARTLARNIVRYVCSWKPGPRRSALYVGQPDGREHLQAAGLALDSYQGGALSPDQVLIVGSGGGRQLAAHAAQIAAFLKRGGHLLCLGLEERDANAFLPFRVRMQKAEHIAAYFDPFGLGSLLAGVSPADVHNRGATQVPLVTGGAQPVGDGVLALARDANVVFFQLPPYHATRSRGDVTSLAVDDGDAAEGTHSAVVTMGAISEAGGQFGQRVNGPIKVGKTYTFAVLVKVVRGPVRMRLEVERAASPWDRAFKGKDVTVPEGKWTELHATFRADKPYPEGWSAYISCAGEGGVFRADMFRLYEGEYTPLQPGSGAKQVKNLFQNPGFESGRAPWFFRFVEQTNLRRTYRRTSFLLSRVLANMGAAGQTPLLSRFAEPYEEQLGGPVIQNGDFRLDADGDGVADGWTVSGSAKPAARKQFAEIGGLWAQSMTGAGEGSVMLAQSNVPMKEGQWYRISFMAYSPDMGGTGVDLTVQDTSEWRSLFDYQRFAPIDRWKEFSFLVRSRATSTKTRLQIWYGQSGTLWIANLSMVPCKPPTEGRWLEGLYLDAPQEWDDPYRFFRW